MNEKNLTKKALIAAMLLEISSASQAAMIIVDEKSCSFIDAVAAANTDSEQNGCNAGSGADEIILPNNATINTSYSAVINSEITITGNNSRINLEPSAVVFYVHDQGSLTMNDTIVSGGYSPAGAGVTVYNANLNLNRCTVENNEGGGIGVNRGTATINQSIISGNVSFPSFNFYGAGINIVSSTVSISDSTISNNKNTSGFSGGGGIYATNYFGPVDLTVVNSTISGNVANKGGGIAHKDYGFLSNIRLNNVTMVKNTSSANGGGIYNDSANFTISQSLVSGNNGSVANELFSNAGNVYLGDFNLFGFNKESGVAGATLGPSDMVPSVTSLSDIINENLADNGGLTPTHALNALGPAIDFVPNKLCAQVTDQTGKVRPIDANNDGFADCDVGAFEYTDLIFEDDFELSE